MEAFIWACWSGDPDELSRLVDETAVVWLPGGSTRGKPGVLEELERFHAPDREIIFGDLGWIVGSHRWEAVARSI